MHCGDEASFPELTPGETGSVMDIRIINVSPDGTRTLLKELHVTGAYRPRAIPDAYPLGGAFPLCRCPRCREPAP